jgi:hypothetical protein
MCDSFYVLSQSYSICIVSSEPRVDMATKLIFDLQSKDWEKGCLTWFTILLVILARKERNVSRHLQLTIRNLPTI